MAVYECKCGNVDTFDIIRKGSQVGLYCNVCGKWVKWLGSKEMTSVKFNCVIVSSNIEEAQGDDATGVKLTAMQTRNQCCSKCGKTDKFLMKSGNNIGVYCTSCDSWFMWVGKDRLKAFTALFGGIKESNPIPAQMRREFLITGGTATSDLGGGVPQDTKENPVDADPLMEAAKERERPVVVPNPSGVNFASSILGEAEENDTSQFKEVAKDDRGYTLLQCGKRLIVERDYDGEVISEFTLKASITV